MQAPRPHIKLRRIAILIAAMTLVTAVAWACPSCKDNLDAAANGANLGRGFYYAPFVAVGAITTAIIRANRRGATPHSIPEG
jgi:hypothetical protein